jgi:uncharacterized protein (UPF0548 family)
MPIVLSRPTAELLDRELGDASRREVTYPEVGATRDPQLPGGYRHDRASVVLGNGDAAFQLGKEALSSWQAHHGAGAALTPAAPALREGAVVISTIRIGVVFVTAPCRIVYVTDEGDCFGFAYGTLPGHPECGEEAFHVRRGKGGEIRFDLVAFSRPAEALARLGSPVARIIQRRVTKGYLEGVRRYVRER